MEDRSGQVLAVAVLFFILTWIAVSLRLFVRGCMIRGLGIDDHLMIFLLFLSTSYLVCQLIAWDHGTGRKDAVLTPENKSIALRFWFICELLYIACTCILKISVGFFLLRVAANRWHIWTLRVLMLGAVLFGVSYFFLVLFQCVPVNTYWIHGPRTEGKCWNDSIVLGETYTASTINCAADWVFGILPVFIVWDLNMPKNTKILVIALLSFAAIGSTATIVRAFYIKYVIVTEDFLWATTDVAIWSTVEPGIGITAACIATLRPLLQLLLHKFGLGEEPENVRWRQRRKRSRAGYVNSENSNKMERLHREKVNYSLSTTSGGGSQSLNPLATNNTQRSGTSGIPRKNSVDVMEYAEQCKNNSMSARTGTSNGLDVSITTTTNMTNDDEGIDDSIQPARVTAFNQVAHHASSSTQLFQQYKASGSPSRSRSATSLNDGNISRTRSSSPDFPSVSALSPRLDWTSPRISAITMGWPKNAGSDENV